MLKTVQQNPSWQLSLAQLSPSLFKSSDMSRNVIPTFAKLSLNSTQLQLKLRLRLALIPLSPATHPLGHPATRPPTQPPEKVVSKKVILKNSSRLLQN